MLKNILLVIIVALVTFLTVEVVMAYGGKPSIIPQETLKNVQVQRPSPQVTQEAPEYIIPVTLSIPKINVNAEVEHVGMDSQGRMDVPEDDMNVAWYSLGYKPGQEGNAVFAGHLDTRRGTPAVFWDIGKLETGDEIIVSDARGRKLTFRVTEKAVYPFNKFPLQEVFGESDVPRLNLITCEGNFNQSTRNYSHRTVVYSELVEE